MPPKPAFNNRCNEQVTLTDGRTVWLARASAVVGQICLFHIPSQQWLILLEQRGSGAPDFQGYWCMPCGYVDWDETLCEAIVREVYEEAGLYLPSLSEHPHFGYSASSLVQTTKPFSDEPWAIADTPHGKQNISLHFAVAFSWHGDDLPALSSEHCEPNEIAALAWVPMLEAKTRNLAFNHHLRIEKMCQQLQAMLTDVEQHA